MYIKREALQIYEGLGQGDSRLGIDRHKRVAPPRIVEVGTTLERKAKSLDDAHVLAREFSSDVWVPRPRFDAGGLFQRDSPWEADRLRSRSPHKNARGPEKK